LAVAALGPVFLLACAAQKPARGPTFSLDTPVEKISADPRGKAILDRDVPDLMASRRYVLFEDMSLSQIATLSGGRLTKAKLDLIEDDLSRLSATGKAGE
jgi:hypothetical protein